MTIAAIELCDWVIRHDPEDVGEAAGWAFAPARVGWMSTPASSAWQKTLGVDAIGVAWYRTSLPLSFVHGVPANDANARYWVRFQSVATDCRAWVNGKSIGGHVGDFVAFDLEVPSGAGEGNDAELVVRVDQMHAPRPLPGVMQENGHLTKGFHDVLSIQHAGIWQPVTLRRTGPIAIIPNGIAAIPEALHGGVRVVVEVHEHSAAGEIDVEIRDESGRSCGRGRGTIAPGIRRTELRVEVEQARAWSPETPVLYSCLVKIGVRGEPSDADRVRFGFRTLVTGGPEKGWILLNGSPLLVRGLLHWGHEPEHMSPAPTREEVRAQFARMRESGFNCTCLCMVYLPESFYEIADEMGMLVWQEHPIWKSDMAEEHLPEYERLVDAFLRRDRRHASVVIVSGSCEHERIHPGLGAYWWTRANEELPDRILEVQTAFMAWTNPEQTHLHDEHVYENSGRWGAFLRDVRDEITRVGGKPFVMGETIIANAWPDVPALRSLRDEASRCGEGATHAGAGRDARWTDVTPWYLSRGLEECEALERAIVARYGEDVLDRFRRDAHRFGYQLRTWQIERFRTDPRNAGFVTNHIRDVPLCRCGFMDDLARWRYTCDELRGVLGDSAYLLRTPSDRRAFAGGRSLVFELGVSHFGRGRFSAKATLAIAGACETRLVISADPGAVSWVQSEIVLPDVRTPTLCEVMACDESGRRNSWRVWVMPLAPEVPPDVVRLDGLPYSKGDSTPTFEERAYSSGWGLKCATWSPALPMLDEIVFKCPLWRFDAPLPRGTRVVVTHKFTRGLVDFLERGGHVVLLANPTAGGFGAKTVMLWGQVPLVVEEGPLVPGDSAWVVDLLHYDLMRRSQRAVPTEEMGIASEIEPLVRLVFTHDSGKPKVSDALFAARVGEGVLVVSSLDHVDDPGRYLLSRILAWLTGEEAPKVRGTLSGARARAWAIPGSEARGTHWRAAE